MFDDEGEMEDDTSSTAEEWDAHWKSSNTFELLLSIDEDLQNICGNMLFIWEGNHKIFAWRRYVYCHYVDDANWH